MSTVKTTYLQHPSSTNPNLTLASDGSISGGFPGRNLIVNGSMAVSQRYGSSGVSFGSGSGGYWFGVDRFSAQDYTWSAGSNITMTQESTIVPSGFANSLKIATGATGLTFAAGGYQGIIYRVEGYDIASHYSKTVTLSFWVRSSIPGTYNLFLENGYWGAGTTTRAYAPTYTISSANTWEKKTVTIDMAAATASGTWNKTNGIGLGITWALGANANRTGTGYGSGWTTYSTVYVQDSNAVNWATSANATFYLAGVQLEVGSQATSFEFESYGDTLRKCQRYYEKSYAQGTAPGTNTATGRFYITGASDGTGSVGHMVQFKTTKRTSSYTIKGYTTAGVADKFTYARSGVSDTDTTAAVVFNSDSTMLVYSSIGANYTAGIVFGHWTCDAEL